MKKIRDSWLGTHMMITQQKTRNHNKQEPLEQPNSLRLLAAPPSPWRTIFLAVFSQVFWVLASKASVKTSRKSCFCFLQAFLVLVSKALVKSSGTVFVTYFSFKYCIAFYCRCFSRKENNDPLNWTLEGLHSEIMLSYWCLKSYSLVF